jgi:chromosomal replication initiator protein
MSSNFNYWQLVQDNLKTKISNSNYQAWFSVLEFDAVANEGRKVVLKAPSEFHKNYIEKKFVNELRESVNKYYPKVIHIDFSIKPAVISKVQDQLDLEGAKVSKAIQLSQDHSEPPLVNDGKVTSYLPRKSINNLNPKFTFESFVTTKSTEFITNIANGVINELGTLYSPLFIHSPVGLGKTHLIQAIGHKVLEKDPSLNIKYIPSETLFNQFYLSLKNKEADKFREYYHSVDLLLIDDIQFIGAKDAFQEVFFHIFNALNLANKQVIITADRQPKDLLGIEDRLVSRFSAGLVVDIPKPDKEDRLSILEDKLRRMSLILPTAQVELIAEKVDTNIRELEGVINKVKANIAANPERVINDKALLTILKDFMNNKSYSPLGGSIQTSSNPSDMIIDAICRLFSVDKHDLFSSKRDKEISFARQMSFWLYKNKLNLSYPHIGKIFGGRDHTTIMHGCKKIDAGILAKEESILTKMRLLNEMI